MVRTFLGRVQNKTRPQLLTSDGTIYAPTSSVARAMTPADALDTVYGQYGLEYNVAGTNRRHRTPSGHNFLRNPRGEGGASVPTNWSVNAASGFTVTKIGNGVDANGYAWTELRCFTATVTTGSFLRIYLDNASALPMFENINVALRMAIKVISISVADGALNHRNVISVGPSGTSTSTAISLPTLLGQDWSVRECTSLLPVGVTTLNAAFDFTVNNGFAYDFVVRIANPQLEIGTTCGDVSLPPPGTQDLSVAFTRPRTPAMNTTTNRIWNPRFEGAVAGTPGTMPTYWTSAGSLTNGIQRSIVGTGTETGIPYIDLRFQGTATAGTNFWHLLTASTHGLTTPTGIYNFGLNMRLVGGSISGWDTIRLGLEDYDSTPVMIGSIFNDYKANLSPLPLAYQRYYTTLTAGGTSATMRAVLSLTCSLGAVVDITLRIAMPQHEGQNRTTPIFPAVGAPAATVRGVEVPRYAGFIRDHLQGTVVVKFMFPYILSTSNKSIFSVNNGGINPEIYCYVNGTNQLIVSSPGNVTILGPVGAIIENKSHTVAVSWKDGGEYVLTLDGVILGRQPYVSPGVMSVIHLGSRNSTFLHNALIETVNYYPSPFGDAMLIEMTR